MSKIQEIKDRITETKIIRHSLGLKEYDEVINDVEYLLSCLKESNEAFKEINEIIDSFYGEQNRIKPELRSIAGETQVICKIATEAMKSCDK